MQYLYNLKPKYLAFHLQVLPYDSFSVEEEQSLNGVYPTLHSAAVNRHQILIN